MAASGRASASKPFRVIEPASGWRSIDYRELWEYRDVLYFLVRRDIRVRYTQSVFGIGWAVIQPVFFMIVFSIVFGRLAGVRSDGVPYPISASRRSSPGRTSPPRSRSLPTAWS